MSVSLCVVFLLNPFGGGVPFWGIPGSHLGVCGVGVIFLDSPPTCETQLMVAPASQV